jgi:hypothetical protein
MKVDIPFSMQMVDQGSVESVVNALVLHAAWKETRGADQTSGRGVESVFTSNLEMSSFRTSAHVGCVTRYIDQALRPHVVPLFARHLNYNFQDDNALDQPPRATRDILQQNNRGYALACS